MPLEIPQPLAEHPELTVEVTTGIEHWRVGQIALAVGGDGSVEVRNRRAGEEQRFSGRLDGAEVNALGVDLAALDLPGRAGESEPDETPVVIALRHGDEVVSGGEAWDSRRHEDPRLDGVLKRYEAIVADVTGGRLPFGDDGPLR